MRPSITFRRRITAILWLFGLLIVLVPPGTYAQSPDDPVSLFATVTLEGAQLDQSDVASDVGEADAGTADVADGLSGRDGSGGDPDPDLDVAEGGGLADAAGSSDVENGDGSGAPIPAKVSAWVLPLTQMKERAGYFCPDFALPGSLRRTGETHTAWPWWYWYEFHGGWVGLVGSVGLLSLLGYAVRLLLESMRLRRAGSGNKAPEPITSLGEFGAMVTLVLVLVSVAGSLPVLVNCQGHFLAALAASFAMPAAFLVLGILAGVLVALPERTGNDDGSRGNGHRRDSGGTLNRMAQIADWVTKLSIGVGLSQLSELRLLLDRLAADIQAQTGYPGAIVVTIVPASLVVGLLSGFAATWVYLPVVMAAGEREVSSAKGIVRWRLHAAKPADDATVAKYRDHLSKVRAVYDVEKDFDVVIEALTAERAHPLVRDLSKHRADELASLLSNDDVKVEVKVDKPYSWNQ